MKRIMLIAVLIVAAFMANAGGGYDVGDKASDFKLKNIDGTWVSLSDYDDAKGFIVIFTCNHCPYSKAYEERIIDINNEYEDKGYPVIAINPNDPDLYPEDSFENMKKRAEEKGFTFPYLFDAKQEVYPKYGAKRTPHVFLLDKKQDGDLIVEYIGAIDDNYSDASKVEKTYVTDAVDALLKGKKPETTHTKAIGCTIKHK
ncbi:MAG: thioredoxin family protein [Bacteroidales bacterium]|nr:thioredoxin family protein [Bacteroidales bacterium]